MKKWMIYGANGYTGRILVTEAIKSHHKPILAGHNHQELQNLALETQLECRIFNVTDLNYCTFIEGVDLLINCSGPFSRTGKALLHGCSLSGTSYIDLTNELEATKYIFTHQKTWKKCGIFAISGFGISAITGDCISSLLKRKLPNATYLRIGVKSINFEPSQGFLKTFIDRLMLGGRILKNGRIKKVKHAWRTTLIPYAGHPQLSVTYPLAEILTCWYSTRIPNIETYICSSGHGVRLFKSVGLMRYILYVKPIRKFIQTMIIKYFNRKKEKNRKLNSKQPSLKMNHTLIWGEVSNYRGQAMNMNIRVNNPYRFTVDATLVAITMLMDEPIAPGAYTPSTALNPDLIYKIKDCEVGDLTFKHV